MSPAISMEKPKRSRSWIVSPFRFCEDSAAVLPAVLETADDPKAFWRQGLQLSASGLVQQNWGRIQAEEHEQFANRLDPPIGRLRPQSRTPEGTHLFEGLQRSAVPPSMPPTNREHVLQDALIIQLYNELQEATDRQECLARITSWLNRVEKLVPGSHQGALAATPKVVVLERLEGYVDRIEGGTAYVTLKSQYGDELTGEYASQELAAKGITEGRRFRCETVEVDGAVHVLFEAVPEESVAEDEEDAIRRRIAELVQDDELDGDY